MGPAFEGDNFEVAAAAPSVCGRAHAGTVPAYDDQAFPCHGGTSFTHGE